MCGGPADRRTEQRRGWGGGGRECTTHNEWDSNVEEADTRRGDKGVAVEEERLDDRVAAVRAAIEMCGMREWGRARKKQRPRECARRTVTYERTLADIIWASGAASMMLCHVLVEPGMTKPNVKNHSAAGDGE